MNFNIFVAIMGCKFIQRERKSKRKKLVEKDRNGRIQERKGQKNHNNSTQNFIYLFIYNIYSYFPMANIMMSVSTNRLLQRRLLK
jgi:hypothetical protein